MAEGQRHLQVINTIIRGRKKNLRDQEAARKKERAHDTMISNAVIELMKELDKIDA